MILRDSSSFCLAFFLVALDQTILSTALPTIASHFDAVSDLSWIASGYFLPQAAFMLFFGRVLAFCPPKTVFMTSITIFEIGSLLCAVSPNVNVLILGRAVAGFGGTGLWASIMSITAMVRFPVFISHTRKSKGLFYVQVTSLKQRPMLMALFGGVFAISSIIGPLVGGAFSDHVSWRWCFYINLPIGGVALLVVAFTLPSLLPADQLDVSPEARQMTMSKKWKELDWIGCGLSLLMITMLLIALQWGGDTKSWSSPIVIAFLVAAAVSFVGFLLWEWKLKERALLPFEILLRRNVCGASACAFFVFVSFVVFNVSLFPKLLATLLTCLQKACSIIFPSFIKYGVIQRHALVSISSDS